MRTILLFLLMSAPAAASWPNGYTYRRTVTIDHTKVPGNLTNFPVLVCFNGGTGTNCDGVNANTSLPELKTVGNGGHVQNTVSSTQVYTHTICADCIFTDSDASTVLSFEIVLYNAASGFMEAWVKNPAVSSTVDTVMYIYYGNASVTTDQTSANAVWDSNYKMVYHNPDGTTIDLHDSTSNAVTLTNNGGAAAAGQIDGGFNTFTGNYASTSSGVPTVQTVVTISMWMQPVLLDPFQSICLQTSTAANGWGFSPNGPGTNKVDMYTRGVQDNNFTTLPVPTTGVWSFFAGTFTGGTLVGLMCTTGSCTSETLTSVSNPNNGNGGFFEGKWDGAGNPCNSVLDEVRFSVGIARSANWNNTEYNNQNSPNTFYTLGPESTNSTGLAKYRVINGDL
jgi:concanavalin A-like lectin/glucanase superfamily protein